MQIGRNNMKNTLVQDKYGNYYIIPQERFLDWHNLVKDNKLDIWDIPSYVTRGPSNLSKLRFSEFTICK